MRSYDLPLRRSLKAILHNLSHLTMAMSERFEKTLLVQVFLHMVDCPFLAFFAMVKGYNLRIYHIHLKTHASFRIQRIISCFRWSFPPHFVDFFYCWRTRAACAPHANHNFVEIPNSQFLPSPVSD